MRGVTAWKKEAEELFRDGEVRHGGVPLEAEKQKPAAEQQNAGGCQNELAVQLQALPAEAARTRSRQTRKPSPPMMMSMQIVRHYERVGHIIGSEKRTAHACP